MGGDTYIMIVRQVAQETRFLENDSGSRSFPGKMVPEDPTPNGKWMVATPACCSVTILRFFTKGSVSLVVVSWLHLNGNMSDSKTWCWLAG